MALASIKARGTPVVTAGRERAKALLSNEEAKPVITAAPKDAVATAVESSPRAQYGVRDGEAPIAEQILEQVQKVEVREKIAHPAQGAVTVTDKETLLRVAMPNRIEIDFYNDGPNTVYIAYERGVTPPGRGGNGHAVPAGGSWHEEHWKGAIYGVTSNGVATMTFLEV